MRLVDAHLGLDGVPQCALCVAQSLLIFTALKEHHGQLHGAFGCDLQLFQCFPQDGFFPPVVIEIPADIGFAVVTALVIRELLAVQLQQLIDLGFVFFQLFFASGKG